MQERTSEFQSKYANINGFVLPSHLSAYPRGTAQSTHMKLQQLQVVNLDAAVNTGLKSHNLLSEMLHFTTICRPQSVICMALRPQSFRFMASPVFPMRPQSFLCMAPTRRRNCDNNRSKNMSDRLNLCIFLQSFRVFRCIAPTRRSNCSSKNMLYHSNDVSAALLLVRSIFYRGKDMPCRRNLVS